MDKWGGCQMGQICSNRATEGRIAKGLQEHAPEDRICPIDPIAPFVHFILLHDLVDRRPAQHERAVRRDVLFDGGARAECRQVSPPRRQRSAPAHPGRSSPRARCADELAEIAEQGLGGCSGMDSRSAVLLRGGTGWSVARHDQTRGRIGIAPLVSPLKAAEQPVAAGRSLMIMPVLGLMLAQRPRHVGRVHVLVQLPRR